MKDLLGQNALVPKFKHGVKDAYKAALGAIGYEKASLVPDEYEKVIFFVLDGLGYKTMEKMGVLKKTQMKSHEIGSTIPSVTPTALASMFTGVDPATHGVVGISFWMSKISAGFTPLGFINLSSGTVSEVEPTELLLSESLVKTSSEEGVDTRVVLPESVDNGLSYALYEGSTANFVPSLGGVYYGLSKFLRSKKESVAISYHEQPDTLIHRGYSDSSIKAELASVFSIIKRLRSQKAAKKTALIFVGDHGSIEMNGISELISISEYLRNAPLGGARHRHLFLKKGVRDQVLERLQGSYVFDTKDLLDKKLLGKAHEETYNRMGDLFLIAKDDNAFIYDSQPHNSDHGGLTENEMSTAFLSCTLKDFSPLKL